MGDLVPQLAFSGTSSFALTTLGLPNHYCCCCCQTPAQDLVSPTEPQKKTEPKLPLKQIWDQKKTNKKHRGGQLFASLRQTGLTENPTRKVRKTMASDKNGRKTQADSFIYLLYLPIWIFFLPVTTSGFLTLQKSLEMSNLVPQEAKGEMSILFIIVWCKPLIHIPCDTVYSGLNLPAGDAMYSWDRI